MFTYSRQTIGWNLGNSTKTSTPPKVTRASSAIEALRAFLAPDPENELISIKRRLSDVENLLEGLRSPKKPYVYSLKVPKACDRRGSIALRGVRVLQDRWSSKNWSRITIIYASSPLESQSTSSNVFSNKSMNAMIAPPTSGLGSIIRCA